MCKLWKIILCSFGSVIYGELKCAFCFLFCYITFDSLGDYKRSFFCIKEDNFVFRNGNYSLTVISFDNDTCCFLLNSYSVNRLIKNISFGSCCFLYIICSYCKLCRRCSFSVCSGRSYCGNYILHLLICSYREYSAAEELVSIFRILLYYCDGDLGNILLGLVFKNCICCKGLVWKLTILKWRVIGNRSGELYIQSTIFNNFHIKWCIKNLCVIFKFTCSIFFFTNLSDPKDIVTFRHLCDRYLYTSISISYNKIN